MKYGKRIDSNSDAIEERKPKQSVGQLVALVEQYITYRNLDDNLLSKIHKYI